MVNAAWPVQMLWGGPGEGEGEGDWALVVARGAVSPSLLLSRQHNLDCSHAIHALCICVGRCVCAVGQKMTHTQIAPPTTT